MKTLEAKKNVAYQAIFPLYDASNTNNLATGQIASWTVSAFYNDDSAVTTWTSFTPTNLASSVQVTGVGVYSILLTASEMNHDRILLVITGDDGSGTTSATEVVIIECKTTDIEDIGVPVSLDGGAQTIAGMLSKMADDNGGASFDAGRDSLRAILSALGQDQYWCEIDLSINSDDDTDLWTVLWKKNAGGVATASLSNVKINVFDREDGSTLIDNKTMTAVGTTGAFKYDAVTSERVGSNAHYIVRMTATIDSETRTFSLIKER